MQIRKFLCHLSLVSCALLAPQLAQAQWRIGGAIGGEHESSWDEFLVLTGEARKTLGTSEMDLAPRFSYFIREGTTRYQVDLNILRPLVLARPLRFTPYLGLGGAFESVSFDGAGGGDDSAVGFNYVVGGMSNGKGALQAYGQFQYTVLNDAPNTAVISAGLLYRLGGK